MQKITKFLIDLGLTSGEALVYTSLLSLGQSNVSSLIKESGVASSKVYFIIELLIQKGLVSYIKVGNNKIFNALEVYRLEELIQQKEEEAKELKTRLADLLLIFVEYAVSEQVHVEMFSGLRGLKTAYRILLQGVVKKDVLRYIYPYQKAHLTAIEFYNKYLPFAFINCQVQGIIRKEIIKSAEFDQLF